MRLTLEQCRLTDAEKAEYNKGKTIVKNLTLISWEWGAAPLGYSGVVLAVPPNSPHWNEAYNSGQYFHVGAHVA